MEKPESGIILADLQFPNHNGVLLGNVEKYMASRKWEWCIYLGDFLDMDAISHHAYNAGEFRALEGKRLKRDYDDASSILRRHRKILGPKTKMVWFTGNHEEWATRLVDKMPGLEGLIEVEYNLPFEELDIEIIPARQFKKIGRIYFIHGDFERGAYVSANHAKKVLDIYGRNMVYGDKHTLQVHTKVSPAGIDETHTAYCLPALANINPSWARGKPNQWLNGFGVFHQNATNFSIIPIVSIHSDFISPEGDFYSIKK